jgi:hypothetical protein
MTNRVQCVEGVGGNYTEGSGASKCSEGLRYSF